jgi:hypothetical protein
MNKSENNHTVDRFFYSRKTTLVKIGSMAAGLCFWGSMLGTVLLITALLMIRTGLTMPFFSLPKQTLETLSHLFFGTWGLFILYCLFHNYEQRRVFCSKNTRLLAKLGILSIVFVNPILGLLWLAVAVIMPHTEPDK